MAVLNKTLPTIDVKVADRVALVEFSRMHHQNPFSRTRMQELQQIVKGLEINENVGAIVLAGGKGTSFGVGGDFHETSKFSGGDEVDAWVDDIHNLYATIAGISKPVVAALDGYAIGLGLQIALCCDYRIGSHTCQLIMPELKVGVACSFGGFMLEVVVGRAVMQAMVFTADKWDAERAVRDHLLHEVVPADQLVPRALEQARIIGSWTSAAVRGTRLNINALFLNGLRSVAEQAKRSHRQAFSQGEAQKRMKNIVSDVKTTLDWILVTNMSISKLQQELKSVHPSGVYTYGSRPLLPDKSILWTQNESAPRSTWTASIFATTEGIQIGTAVMNDRLFYSIYNTENEAWAYGTDPFILNFVRSEWKSAVQIVNPDFVHRDDTTSFLDVKRLPANSCVHLSGGIACQAITLRAKDPTRAALQPRIKSFELAGSGFVAALQRAVSNVKDSSHPVAILLSGGIDSGAVTTFASSFGTAVTAYSAGTPWGNEHDEAQELTDFLGITHVRVEFSISELLAAVPETMRALGTANHEKVDIALIITAMIRKGIIKETQILTGYGNDLLNMGLPLDTDMTKEMIENLVNGIEDTRHSGEFTDFVARSRGKRLIHPYWQQGVIETALDIDPSCKVRDGREKAYFRAAMESYVPKTVAWRPKVGIHQGGGLQAGLDNFFGGRDKKIAAYNDCFHLLTHRLLEDPFALIDDIGLRFLEPPDKVVDLAMRAATGPREPPSSSVTFSGLGAVVDSDLPTDTAKLAKFMSKHATRAGFVLARDLQLSEESFKALVQALGDPVQHKYKTGQADLMKLDATREKGKVVVGRGSLPLHTDGILLGKHPDLIVLYASKFEDNPGSGETLICDKVKAWGEMPQRLREILETKTFEYQIEEQKHYHDAPPGWYPIPTFCDLGRIRSLNLALQFEIGQERSWSLRVANVSPAQSDAILAELNAFFLQPRYTYQHRWKVGDLVIIDNHRTLHGRTAISENGIRVLFRGQVVLRKTVPEVDKRKSQYPGAVVLAAPRSGTTLLRKLLNAHPQIHSPPELNLVSALARTLQEVPTSRGFPIGILTNMLIAGIDPETRFVDRLRELIFDIYDTGCQAHGKSMWVDKDVFTGFHVPEVTHLLGKGIKYIWLQRHGLDVAMSQEEKFQEQGVFAHEYHQYIAADRSVLAAATQLWADISRAIALFAARNPDTVLIVKYEDLVRDVEKMMGKIQTFLGANDHLGYICDALRSTEDFGKGDTKIYATKSVHESSVSRWKSLHPETRRRLAPIANPMLRQMGYEEVQDAEVQVEQNLRQAFYDKIVAPMVDS